tara:strand:- start:653 stop:1003 length:351 start_codon:yes stop_codon:yes gene_type:complete
MKEQPQDKNREYELWEDFFKNNSATDDEILKNMGTFDRKFDRRRVEDKDIPPYYTNPKIRKRIDCRLEKLAKENSKVWKDTDELKSIKQTLADEIKDIDPMYYRELFPEDNVTENW